MRTPSDLLLLAVRTAIVALAAIAVLQPLALSSGRKATWAGRIVRAIVVDTSNSVDADAADIAARAEARDAFAARRYDAADPGAALAKAADWLNAAGPARKELVVLSDFQLGTVTAAQIDQVPSSVGIRPVRIARRSSDVALNAGRVLHRDLALDVHVELSGADTRVSLTSSFPDPEGLRIVTGEERSDAATSLMSAVRNAGVLAPSRDQPVVVSFRGSPEEQRDETSLPMGSRRCLAAADGSVGPRARTARAAAGRRPGRCRRHGCEFVASCRVATRCPELAAGRKRLDGERAARSSRPGASRVDEGTGATGRRRVATGG